MKDQISNAYKYSLELKRKPESLFVQSAGCQQCSPEDGWGPGVRNHFLIHHVIRGKGYYVCGEKTYHLQAGDTFLSYPDTTIHYYADEEDPWEYIWVGFSGHGTIDHIKKTDFACDPVYYGRDSEEIHRFLRAICDHSGTAAWESLAMTSQLYALISFLIRTARNVSDEKLTKDCAQLAAEYILDHYAQPITVEGLAEYVCVSHSSLYRRFVKRFQMPPKRFLLEYRIERACEMLVNSDYSIQEISNSVGFEDPFYFSRAFKEIKGMSPRQYANANRVK